MNTMQDYTIHCTESQTKKALKLGAPLEYKLIGIVKPPTAEQMIGWLETKIDNIDPVKREDGTWRYLFYPTKSSHTIYGGNFSSRKEATLAAIDAALDYLIKNKKEE